jgi:hypothetical protein
VRELDASSTAVREKMDAVYQYMTYRQLPAELQSRIRKYYSFYWSRQSTFDESAILFALPSHLRREVTLFLHKDMISKVRCASLPVLYTHMHLTDMMLTPLALLALLALLATAPTTLSSCTHHCCTRHS